MNANLNAEYNASAAPRVLCAAFAAVAAVLMLASVSSLADHGYASVAASHASSIVVASR